MIFEHEIPSGSKLYFAQSAKIKRELEFTAAQMLENFGFEEIVTPLFSYHQHKSFEDTTPLLKLNDTQNHKVTLRADSTTDVVRIVTKRLGRSTDSKKWFYIQPTVTFPTHEQYQVGAEILEGTFEEIAQTTIALLKKMDINPIMQVSNIRIPHILHEEFGVSLEILKSMHIEKIMAINLPWIESLVRISTPKDLEHLDTFPEAIKRELETVRIAIQDIKYTPIVISPLFYAKMRYYDTLTFRMFKENALLAMGGLYTIDGVNAAGFALYTDECISNKINKA